MKIYYFSGTGNSLLLARGLSQLLECPMIPLRDTLQLPSIKPDASAIGIVFPVYFMDLPVMVKEWALKLTGIENTYIFAVCNYGGATGTALKSLGGIIRKKGGRLSGKFGLHMPQNAFLKQHEHHDAIIEKARRKLPQIADTVRKRKSGSFLSALPLYLLLYPFNPLFQGLYHQAMVELAGTDRSLSADAAVLLSDRSYRVSDSCTGCGICARVCPSDNIRMVHNRPQWQNRCQACLGCYNWCPARAISGGLAQKGFYYRNPLIQAADCFHK